jgi:hypothetical protein
MAGGGLTKGLSKGFKSFRKFSGGQVAQRALVGDEIYDKTHFISTGAIKAEDKLKAAEKAAKGAEASAEALRRRQMEDMAKLDDEENNRIKKLLVAGRNGVRGYRGGPMFRARPSNSATRGTAPRSAAGAGSAAPGAAAMRAGGMRGGGSNYRGPLP